MNNMAKIDLKHSDIERDAPFAVRWFTSGQGRQTLLSMGNAESEIEPRTIESEKQILTEFVELEKSGKQITRMIIMDVKTIGVVWIELVEKHDVMPPSIHIMIGDPNYRGKGIGKYVMTKMIKYAKSELNANILFSRHLTCNKSACALLESAGFINDGESYIDKNGLEWQNVKLAL